MADIFLSYARENADLVGPLVVGLEAEGYSVFWDRDIMAGERWKRKVGQELNAAQCVIVAWSETAIVSKYVLDEADEAEDQEKLVPIRLHPVRPPFPYATLHYEEFHGWQGDHDDECWKRLMLRVGSITQPDTPADDQLRLMYDERAEHNHEIRGSIANFAKTRSRERQYLTWRTLGVTAACLTGLFGLSFLADSLEIGTRWQTPILTVTFALAIIAFTLFRLAEIGLSRQFHVLAARWFLPVEGGVRINVGEAFNYLFNAVYGRNHFTGQCLRRSVYSSLVFFAIAMLVLFLGGFADWDVYWGYLRSVVTQQSLSVVDPTVPPEVPSALLLLPLSLIFVPNLVADYASLFQTRVFLRWLKNRPGARWYLATLDILFTTAVFLIVAFGVFWVMSAIWEPETAESPLDLGWSYLQLITMDTTALRLREVEYVSSAFFAHSLLGALITTYGTSLWLVLTLILGPVSRALVWDRRRGPTVLGRLVRVRSRPLTALGSLVAGIVLILGIGFWAISLRFGGFWVL